MHMVIVDTTQIQPYIFGSNRLRENVGASHLVAQATSTWALETLVELRKPHNIRDAHATPERQLEPHLHIEDGQLAIEVVYAGGGNTVVIVRDAEDVEDFIRTLSRRVLINAPGLQLVIAHQPFDWEDDCLPDKIDEMFANYLAEQKRARSLSAPLLGLGVTAMCQSTGGPAVGLTQQIAGDPTSIYPASREIHAKLAAADEANGYLQRLFGAVLGNSYEFPLNIDKLGRTAGDQSYIAIIHADGDGMGQRIRNIGQACQQTVGEGTYAVVNREYVMRLRGFSQAVTSAAHKALENILTTLKQQINREGALEYPSAKQAGNHAAVAPLKLIIENDRYLLPFRPIVLGGDDVTFICDGRLGLSLATQYAQEFAAQTQARAACDGEITACVGISIVKAHYPFARAYELASDLCHSAKSYRGKLLQQEENWRGACLDWHFAFSGLAGSLRDIRKREYTVQSGQGGNNRQPNRLYLRPITLGQNPDERFRAWPVVRRLLDAFQEEEWSTKRNKLKALRDTLRAGPAAVEQFLLQFEVCLPEVGDEPTEFLQCGWRAWGSSEGGYCGYFDAIEMADWFMPLQGVETNEM